MFSFIYAPNSRKIMQHKRRLILNFHGRIYLLMKKCNRRPNFSAFLNLATKFCVLFLLKNYSSVHIKIQKKNSFPKKCRNWKKNRVYFNRVCVLVLSLSLQWRHGQFATFAVFLFKSKPEVFFSRWRQTRNWGNEMGRGNVNISSDKQDNKIIRCKIEQVRGQK